MAKQMLKDEGIEIPMVTTLHGTDITLVEIIPLQASSKFQYKSDIVTSVSESLKEDTYKVQYKKRYLRHNQFYRIR
jgi:hypothetical protein